MENGWGAVAAVATILGVMWAMFHAMRQENRDAHNAIATRINETRTELKNEIGEIRTELKDEIGETRAELKDEIAHNRNEIASNRNEIAHNRNEIARNSAAIQSIARDVGYLAGRQDERDRQQK